MDALLTALADPARWRLVGLLAERPRPVGVLAQLAEARQPQTTKHLQTLERAGVVSSQRAGQRRIYSLRSAPLRELAAALSGLADTADQLGGAQETFDRYALSMQTERLAADGQQGAYGFYEAIDYTPSRLPPGVDSISVRQFMAHHEGMSLLSLTPSEESPQLPLIGAC